MTGSKLPLMCREKSVGKRGEGVGGGDGMGLRYQGEEMKELEEKDFSSVSDNNND